MRWGAAACLSLLLACGSAEPDPSGHDAGRDAATAADAGGADGGPTVDAAAPLDATAGDGSTHDAGLDAGAGDAGSPAEATCTSDADCPMGMGCSFVPTPPGVCTASCVSDADCTTGPGATCGITAPYCTASCDPITNEGCAGLACGFYDTTATGGAEDTTFCHAFGTGGHGASCETGGALDPNSCAAENTCIPTPSPPGFTCMRKCRIGPGADCPSGSTCTRVGGDGVWIGGVEYGVCVGP